MGKLCLFAPHASRDLGVGVAQALGVELCALEEREFEDGEHKSRPLVNVRGADVFVVHSLYGDPQQSVNDKLCRLLFLLGALRDASALQVTAVVPYLCYARKDRKTKPRDPVTTRYIAELMEAVGVDRVITMDVHNLTAFQNAFRCRTDHLEARRLFVEHLLPQLGEDEIAVVSPDIGGIKRAEQFRQTLAAATARPVEAAFVEKRRSAGAVSGGSMVGDVKDKTVIMIDDMIVTGTSLVRAAVACKDAGATTVIAVATHGLFMEGADQTLADAALDSIVVTDSVPPNRLRNRDVAAKLEVIGIAPMIASAIECTHGGGSIVDLLG